MVAHHDLELRSQLFYDVEHEPEHRADGHPVRVFFGEAALVVVL
jgi:hypothetical protein